MAYSVIKQISIDHTKAGGSNSTNFPVLFSGVYPDLATVAHGGSVTNNSGFDIVFTSDAAGAILLKWEIESYDPITGTVNFWVQVPTLSHTANTIIYLLYGNAAITTFQGGSTGAAWDASFLAVYHFGSSLTADSTTHAATLTNTNVVTAGTGQIDGDAVFVGASSQKLTATISNPNPAITMEGWIKSATLNTQMADIEFDTSGPRIFPFSDGNIYAYGAAGGGQIHFAAPSNNVWHQISSTTVGTTATLYIDGVPVASGATLAVVAQSAGLALGFSTTGNSYLTGSLDEVRISSSARSADWILASFNSQSSPSTFYALAAVFSISGSLGSGGAGATVTLSGAASATTTADGSGNYSFLGLLAGTYVITPGLTGFAFSPTNQTTTVVASNITGVNFTTFTPSKLMSHISTNRGTGIRQ